MQLTPQQPQMPQMPQQQMPQSNVNMPSSSKGLGSVNAAHRGAIKPLIESLVEQGRAGPEQGAQAAMQLQRLVLSPPEPLMSAQILGMVSDAQKNIALKEAAQRQAVMQQAAGMAGAPPIRDMMLSQIAQSGLRALPQVQSQQGPVRAAHGGLMQVQHYAKGGTSKPVSPYEKVYSELETLAGKVPEGLSQEEIDAEKAKEDAVQAEIDRQAKLQVLSPEEQIARGKIAEIVRKQAADLAARRERRATAAQQRLDEDLKQSRTYDFGDWMSLVGAIGGAKRGEVFSRLGQGIGGIEAGKKKLAMEARDRYERAQSVLEGIDDLTTQVNYKEAERALAEKRGDRERAEQLAKDIAALNLKKIELQGNLAAAKRTATTGGIKSLMDILKEQVGVLKDKDTAEYNRMIAGAAQTRASVLGTGALDRLEQAAVKAGETAAKNAEKSVEYATLPDSEKKDHIDRIRNDAIRRAWPAHSSTERLIEVLRGGPIGAAPSSESAGTAEKVINWKDIGGTK